MKKDFGTMVREFAEDFRKYIQKKEATKAAEEGETILLLATNDKKDVNLSVIRGSVFTLACILADRMRDSERIKEAVYAAVKLYEIHPRG